MDARPIAVFDSGLGGLTAVRALISQHPQENIIYFGDTARVPYGTRSNNAIIHFVNQAFRFLGQYSPKAVIVACGTASAVALPHIQCDAPITGVVRPAVEKAAAITQNGTIGLIATPASVRSSAYPDYLAEIAPDMRMVSSHGRLLVPLIEAGRVSPDDPVAVMLVEEYMAPFIEQGVDTLILGCTHYPLLANLMGQVLGKGVTLINSGSEAVNALLGRIEHGGYGQRSYFVTDDIGGFAQQASLFLEVDIAGTVDHVDIDCL